MASFRSERRPRGKRRARGRDRGGDLLRAAGGDVGEMAAVDRRVDRERALRCEPLAADEMRGRYLDAGNVCDVHLLPSRIKLIF